MSHILPLALGGAAGTYLRFILSFFNGPLFPIGTFLANLTGSFFLGFFYSFTPLKKRDPKILIFFTTGFCGSLTTFSTFSLEAINGWHAGDGWLSLIYVGMSLLSGMLAAILGIWTAGKVVRL